MLESFFFCIRIQVFQSDGTFVGKFGSIGSRAGMLEHPHYIAVSNMNRVIVSDSNNHRIQIFDINGRSILSFGSEGSKQSPPNSYLFFLIMLENLLIG